tara:strand:+ start:231 stop:494 length:264 start_codon:yes stop_codon:yes gene_type:complete
MALVETTIVDKIEIVGEFKHIQVRLNTQIIDNETNEVKSTGKYTRYVLAPTADVSNESADVKAIASAIWTDEIKTAYTKYAISVSGV